MSINAKTCTAKINQALNEFSETTQGNQHIKLQAAVNDSKKMESTYPKAGFSRSACTELVAEASLQSMFDTF